MSEERFMIRCAVYVLFIKENKILMFKRQNTGWQDGLFGIPGGHLEKNETVLEAAIREAKEETGLEVNENELELIHTSHRHYIPGFSKETNFDYIDFVFLTKSWRGEPKITEKNKSEDMIWVDLDKLPENSIESVKAFIYNYKNNLPFSIFTN